MRIIYTRLLALFLVTCGILPVQAQLILNRQVTASTGGSGVAGGLLFQYTIGDVATTTITGSALRFTQGFQQPEELPPLPPASNYAMNFMLFPNPAATTLKIQFDLKANATVVVLIINAAGQLIHQETAEYGAGKVLITTPVNHYAPGIYTVMMKVGGYVFKEKLIVQ